MNNKIEINFTTDEISRMKYFLGNSFEEKIKSKILEMVFDAEQLHSKRYLLVRKRDGFAIYSSDSIEDVANHKYQEDVEDCHSSVIFGSTTLPSSSHYEIFDTVKHVVLDAQQRKDYKDFFYC